MNNIISHLIGIFVIDDHGTIIEKKLHHSLGDYESAPLALEALQKKHKAQLANTTEEKLILLPLLKNSEYFKAFKNLNLEQTKLSIKESVRQDQLLIQASNTYQDAEKVANQLAKCLREWYELYNPETSYAVDDHEKFVETILSKSKEELLGPHLKNTITMGADLGESDIDAIMNLAKKVQDLYHYKKYLESYEKQIMKELCPNLLELTGANIGAKLIAHAGSLERLAILPASTIQVLGAEKALFRHLTKKAKMPKYGIIFQHQLIGKVPSAERGKAARALADKISLASKIDRFKGNFMADKLIEELEKRFTQWK